MSLEPGLFVVVEGPSGVGKSTVVEHLRADLTARDIPVVATTEPSDSTLGKLARQGTDEYRGLERSAQRASDRGVCSRFHHGGAAARAVEDRLYRDLVRQLQEADSDVLHHEVTDEPAESVAAVVLGAVLQRWEQRSG